MNRSARFVALFVAMMFALSLFAGCSLNDLKNVDNMKLGKYGQTINVKKANLSKSIKTQYGTFKFSSKQVTKIKKLKKKKVYRTTKKIKKKSYTVVVTYLGSSRYQVVVTYGL